MNDKMFVNEVNKLKEKIKASMLKLEKWQYQELDQVKTTIRDIINKASDLESLIDQKQWEEPLY